MRIGYACIEIVSVDFGGFCTARLDKEWTSNLCGRYEENDRLGSVRSNVRCDCSVKERLQLENERKVAVRGEEKERAKETETVRDEIDDVREIGD